MKKRMGCICGMLFLCLGLWGLPLQEARADKLEDHIKMPLLKGTEWQHMTPDSKVAFIWGAGHVVTIERALMNQISELKRDSFVMKVGEALGGVPINIIVAKVDEYYKFHPDQLEVPVMRVIWDTMIKPNIKTGIAGRPLK
jgi:hypothetical protein